MFLKRKFPMSTNRKFTMFKPKTALILIAAGFAMSTASAEDEIVIGAATSNSGWMAAFDAGPTKAAQLAIDDINAKGGVLGRKLKFITIDTKTDQSQTARAAQSLVEQNAQMIMTACDFDNGAPAALVAQKANRIAIGSCGADIKYGNLVVGNNVFTMATNTSTTGRIMADWGARKKGWKTAYVLLDSFIEYDKSLCRGFVERWKEVNGATSVVLEDSFKNADVSVASQISRYQALGKPADAMMLCSVPPGLASTIKQFRAAGVSIPVMAGTGGDGSSWHSAVPGLSNYFYLNYSADAGVKEMRPDAEEFLAKYEKKYGERPASGQTITGYSVVQAWARAAERAKSTDAAAVRAELEKFKDESLAVGLTTFSSKLHIDQGRPMLIVSINNSKPEPLGYYDIRKGDYVK
jgi:branched-chain amino acid transport system substrate-binding protein